MNLYDTSLEKITDRCHETGLEIESSVYLRGKPYSLVKPCTLIMFTSGIYMHVTYRFSKWYYVITNNGLMYGDSTTDLRQALKTILDVTSGKRVTSKKYTQLDLYS